MAEQPLQVAVMEVMAEHPQKMVMQDLHPAVVAVVRATNPSLAVTEPVEMEPAEE
jgi:hypothetical protein